MHLLRELGPQFLFVSETICPYPFIRCLARDHLADEVGAAFLNRCCKQRFSFDLLLIMNQFVRNYSRNIRYRVHRGRKPLVEFIGWENETLAKHVCSDQETAGSRRPTRIHSANQEIDVWKNRIRIELLHFSKRSPDPWSRVLDVERFGPNCCVVLRPLAHRFPKRRGRVNPCEDKIL